MRNISFALTTEQILARTKTVTRRLGWKDLRSGTLLQPVRQAMGLKRGAKVEKLGGPILVTGTRREHLSRMLRDAAYGADECIHEGFARMTALQFVVMFCRTHDCTPGPYITRIEFEYTEVPHG